MDTKSFDARIKAVGKADGLEEGQFRAIVSAFNNVDSYGEVVVPGAFTEDLEEWRAKGDLIPVIWSHDWNDPFSHLGYALEAAETEKGLEILGQIDMDGNPKAEQVHRLMKGRRVTQFSFAYDVKDAAWAERDGEDVYELRKLKTYEVGPCLIGVNQETELLAVKAKQLAATKGANARPLGPREVITLRAVYKSLGDLLGPTETPAEAPATVGQTTEPSQVGEPSTDEDRVSGKSDSIATSAPRRALAVARITDLS